MTNSRVLVLAVTACCFLAHTTAYEWPLSTIKLRLYSKDLSYKEFAAENASEIVPFLAVLNKTLFHCHGYTQTPDDKDMVVLSTNYLEGTNHNVILADYRYVTYNTYSNAVALASAIAGVLLKAIEDMVLAGMNKSLLMLTGFSLGAQIAGEIARNASFVVPQIVGMDPAGPLYDNSSLLSLSASDAACVKCIHTDSGYYGTETACGHQEYYPNSGVRFHPGCPIFSTTDPMQTCSHFRGEHFGGETAKYPNSYLAIKCNSWDYFKAGTCDTTNIVSMGLDAPCSVTGKFYLQTNYQSPFGLGQAGLTYNETLANMH